MRRSGSPLSVLLDGKAPGGIWGIGGGCARNRELGGYAWPARGDPFQLGVRATVDSKVRTGDIRGFRTGNKRHQCRDLVSVPVSA